MSDIKVSEISERDVLLDLQHVVDRSDRFEGLKYEADSDGKDLTVIVTDNEGSERRFRLTMEGEVD